MTLSTRGRAQLHELFRFGGMLLLGVAIISAAWLLVTIIQPQLM